MLRLCTKQQINGRSVNKIIITESLNIPSLQQLFCRFQIQVSRAYCCFYSIDQINETFTLQIFCRLKYNCCYVTSSLSKASMIVAKATNTTSI